MTTVNRRRFLAHTASLATALRAAGFIPAARAAETEPLPNTKPLDLEGDLARLMVDGMHKFLDRELAASVEKRKALWKPDFSSPEAYQKSLEPHRQRLRKIIGAVDERIKPVTMEIVTSLPQPLSPKRGEGGKKDDSEPAAPPFPFREGGGGLGSERGEGSKKDAAEAASPPFPLREGGPGGLGSIAKGDGYSVYAVRWPVFEGVDGEGLLLQPDKEPVARVVALPDCDWSPEMFVGLVPGIPHDAGLNQFKSQVARLYAENRCQVIVPVLVNRADTWSGNQAIGRLTNQPHREFIYRMAFEVGRHVIGFEIQKVLAAVDWFVDQNRAAKLPIGIIGCGEGGLLALISAALDTRIVAAQIYGHFGPREKLWTEPIYRNIWGFVLHFGDAELADLVFPRPLFLALGDGPRVDGPPPPRDGRSGAAPGRIEAPNADQALEEVRRTTRDKPEELLDYKHGLKSLGLPDPLKWGEKPPIATAKVVDPAIRLKRQFDQLVEFTQKLVRPHADVRRQEFVWSKLNLKSQDDYKKSIEPLRKYFWEEVIGKLPPATDLANPRTRLLHDEPKWKAYEVVLDVYPDVIAQGILTVPKDLKKDERRPVVVCQHGLEGRPNVVVSPKEKTKYYNSFGSALADRGFVVFAPQNPYIFQNHFRQLQRKANPLKLSLFSFIVRQHEQILDWLATLAFVDDKRIGFYGLSYGGKTAMRVPAILERYCLSICSGDFNEWIWKNTAVDFRGSYMFTGEYEMFEFDLGNTFNYAEMAALIAPRPFMVERGHDDGVGIDEWVAYEYAKVRRLYAKLGIPDRTAIEFFNGGHEINSQGTFVFLHKHLAWPEP